MDNNGWLVITSYYQLLPVITNIGVIDDRSWKKHMEIMVD